MQGTLNNFKNVKKMDSGSAIIGALLFVICVVPFLIMYYNRIKKEKKMLKILNENVKQQNCKISEHEFCGDFVLGIDKSKNFVFFFKRKVEEESIYQCIDLSEIKACQVVKKIRNSKNEIENLSNIERIELGFIPINKNKGETRLELYNEDTNLYLGGELQFVEKWSTRINDHLKSIKQ